MKLRLRDFQERAVDDIVDQVRSAIEDARPGREQAVVLSAPTGSGKTIMAIAAMERILVGDSEQGPKDVAFLWVTDQPELNLQTEHKFHEHSTVFGAMRTVILSSDFDEPALMPGRLYFLNTQKLGQDKRLSSYGDRRSFRFWDTLARTASELGGRFVVLLDEAHRGMNEDRRAQARATTIMQKFVKGSPDEIPPMPLILGISATPKRFVAVLEGSTRTLRHVTVTPEEVRTSGLLKQAIRLYYSDDDAPSDMTLLREAARTWRKYADVWERYTTSAQSPPVHPILVVQVEDGTKSQLTRSPLAEIIAAINEEAGPFPPSAFAHAFQEGTAVSAGAHDIRYVAPSGIESDAALRVVFFKTSLNTGWDCPRAETMMSFRSARDATLIAQLIGRMVRTPLARSVEEDEFLNTVALYLPHYDRKSIDDVVRRLSDEDYADVPPTKVELGKDMVTLGRCSDSDRVFGALGRVPSYIVPKPHRRHRDVGRFMRLARLLAQDQILPNALELAQEEISNEILKTHAERRSSQEFISAVEAAQSVRIGEIRVETTGSSAEDRTSDEGSYSLRTARENVEDRFARAGRRLGNGLHKVVWKRLVGGSESYADIRRAKLEIAVLLDSSDLLVAVRRLAQARTERWLRDCRAEIRQLDDERRDSYREVQMLAEHPELCPVDLPDRIEVRREPAVFSKHAYVDVEGAFFAKLNNWEVAVVLSEIRKPETVAWLRNPPRKPWSITVPYQARGEDRPMFPDFFFVRRVGKRLEVDVLDPHDPSLEDAPAKAVGLARYAERHGSELGRILLIAQVANELRALDLQEPSVRGRVLTVSTAAHLKGLYADMAHAL